MWEDWREAGVGTGVVLSVGLAFPLGFINFLLPYPLYLIFPYATYFSIASVLGLRHYTKLGKGLALGGAAVSTLIAVGVVLLILGIRGKG